MTRSTAFWPLVAAVGAVLAGCPDDPEPPKLAEGIYGALGSVLPTATPEQQAAFERGRVWAETRFTPEEGLGPHFNTSFCGSCHNRPITGGSGGRYRNFLLTRQTLPDGSVVETGVNGVHPFLQNEGPARRPLGEGTNLLATRNPIPFFGSGLIAELFEDAIVAHADPSDLDGDGISGRANYDRGFVGRFGRKAQTVSLEGFIRGPLFNHLGITSNPLPDELKNALPVPSGSAAVMTSRLGLARSSGLAVGTTARGQAAAPDEPNEDDDAAPDPELSEEALFDLVSFTMLLAAPRPEPLEGASARGKEAFSSAGCDGCHVPTLAGPRGLVPLYSDLLLHDMGPDLSDGMQMGLAEGSEFRTQPLWGVVATGPWLHDGRADSLHEAIALHGGEASASRDRYLALPAESQIDLQAFLASLGGRDMVTPGLILPSEPEPSPGDLGGPMAAATPEAQARFEAGRVLFDRNFGLSEGIGPRFNGDSCRACHFEPVIGGAGPIGLNVMRQAVVDNGVFRAPAMGTMAHRLLARANQRAPGDPEANVFEMRQPQPLFGLGLVDRIPDADILARADPDDADGDGIRGVAQVLPDGRLGRYGWKADIPTLAEFVGDAMAMELGMTVPQEAGLTFGRAADEDDAPDPEVSMAQVGALVDYLELLAPPPGGSMEPAAAERGERLFGRVGCDGCHVADWTLADGTPVPVYSDFLVHEVLPEGAVGIELHGASMRAFRTAPLWGVGLTSPYMHDGRASTLEAAIAAHAGEGSASAEAVSTLTAEDRMDLLSFLRSL